MKLSGEHVSTSAHCLFDIVAGNEPIKWAKAKHYIVWIQETPESVPYTQILMYKKNTITYRYGQTEWRWQHVWGSLFPKADKIIWHALLDVDKVL
jgi:hypothetical protein